MPCLIHVARFYSAHRANFGTCSLGLSDMKFDKSDKNNKIQNPHCSQIFSMVSDMESASPHNKVRSAY